LARKVSGTLVGIWLMVPEHLRLGTWDLLCAWAGAGSDQVQPRLAMQLVHEAALCVTGVREKRCLSHQGFELANGLPFVGSDVAIHDLLHAHTVADAQTLQVGLGKVRWASRHYEGRLLALDPHRLVSYSQRQMPKRRANPQAPSTKTAQTFFALDADTSQPVCLYIGSSGRTVAHASVELLDMVRGIFGGHDDPTLILADCEHFTTDLLEHIHHNTPFDILVPLPQQPYVRKRIAEIPPEQFTPRWAGLATAQVPYQLVNSDAPPFHLIVQRCGERSQDYSYKAFLCTTDVEEADTLTLDFPQRWHIEEFFNLEQALGWKRAGTLNLNIRYGRMTMALMAQAAIHQLRQRLSPPTADWDAAHLADKLFRGLDGDIRVRGDTILVTYYNAPDADHLRPQFEHLPEHLSREGVDPRIPWLYDLKLDFRFK